MTTEIRSTNGKLLYSSDIPSIYVAINEAVDNGVSLAFAKLENLDLRHLFVKYADLRGASFRGSDLSGSQLYLSKLSMANFSNTTLKRSFLGGSDLRLANFKNSVLTDAILQNVWAYGVDFTNANLSNANLQDATLEMSLFDFAVLEGTDLRGAKLSGASVRNVQGGINRHLVNPLLMLYDQPGKIRAYKLVDKNYEGVFYGGIRCRVGDTIVENLASDDVTDNCSRGISVATLSWCLSMWNDVKTNSFRIMIVEFEAQDIACIPTTSNGKFRLYRCKIVGEIDPRDNELLNNTGE